MSQFLHIQAYTAALGPSPISAAFPPPNMHMPLPTLAAAAEQPGMISPRRLEQSVPTRCNPPPSPSDKAAGEPLGSNIRKVRERESGAFRFLPLRDCAASAAQPRAHICKKTVSLVTLGPRREPK